MKKIHAILGLALVGVFILSLFTPAWAEDVVVKTPKCDISVGFWSADFDGGVSGTVNGVSGSQSLKDNMQLTKTSPMILGLKYHFNPKNLLNLGYSSIDQSATGTISANLPISGSNTNATFVPGPAYNSLKIQFLDVAWEHSFVEKSTGDAGFTLGFKNVDLKYNLSQTVPVAISTEVSGSAPIPQIGLYGNLKLGEKMYGYGRLAGLSVKTGSTQGELMDYRAGISYDFTKELSGVLDYRYMRLFVKDDKSNEIWLKYAGPALSLSYKF
jgi:hypothetical protein